MRYGIIGCGMMGQEHIRNIRLLGGAEVTAILEPDAGMRAEAQGLAPDAVIYNSLTDLVANPDLDAVVIASPNHQHLPQLEKIAATRALPVLLEKPAFTDPDDLPRLQHLHSAYPALIWVAMEYRYMPPIARFLDLAAAETGGIRLLSIREHRFPFLQKIGDWNRFNRNTGGTMVEKCCHFFDLMRLAIGADPVRVIASAGQAVNHLEERYGGEAPDIWDNGYVIVDFANGARAMLELCMFAEGSRYQEELSAVGPTGKLEALVPGPMRMWPDHLGTPPVPRVVVSPRAPQGPVEIDVPVDPTLLEAGDHNGATYYQHKLFLEALQTGTAPEVSLEDGIAAVRMGLAAQQSAREGVIVPL
ncbi:Gfo/Idh/MocA family oxidoreductase [Rhodophyticola sp. CCM32]|uniref:Gfo/Idh/MocA family protein n=1 Tax=Rhodophyticola sp. CCM32 TaxID=2916397 RepID=UPI00107FB85B|nr:Gfo/Idh/MocA family oxidoreductase [Rhodophyticola sp. CCM32]QBY00657.1 Gfo/Idh/MocA family oxidoreductase [Rhodophyticola sp. CCM32]